MVEQEGDIGELKEVYEALRRDARDLLSDLEDSIESRSSSATLILYGGFFVVAVSLGAYFGKAFDYTTFLESEGVGILLLAYGAWEKITSRRLTRKYGGLFSAAKKLK